MAGLTLAGPAKEVVVTGDADNIETQTAYVATGSHCLAIVDASQFNIPIVLGQLDLPGDAVDVAVDQEAGLAVVASGAGGLHFVDVSDPIMPRLIRTDPLNTTHVEIFRGLVYASDISSIRLLEVTSGLRIGRLDLGGAAISDIARDGQILYTMDANRTLRSISLSGLSMLAAPIRSQCRKAADGFLPRAAPCTWPLRRARYSADMGRSTRQILPTSALSVVRIS